VFEDKTNDWGVSLPTYSNGAAYADFDNDGDLDLVTNNIDQEVILYENNADKLKEKKHFIRLVSKEGNIQNQKIRIYTNGTSQFQELTPYRGFQSSVANYAHFGLGQNTKVDSIVVQWMDGVQVKFDAIKADTILMYSKEIAQPFYPDVSSETQPLFKKTSVSSYIHRETSPPDIKNTRTLLHELSRYGPCIASGDINGDARDDLFVGGEPGSASRLFIQQADGGFVSTPFSSDSTREDGGALFFDVDNDDDLDVYIAGASPSGVQVASQHQLYKNDGNGEFTLASTLPEIYVSASCIEAADYDDDGDLDLFVGGRIKPNEYPLPPRSYVLRNDHGKFTDVTVQLNPALEHPGMISSGVWADVDRDGKADLIIAGEWMPIRVFKNDGATFREITKELGLENTNGWWNCIKAADLNEDGHIDIVAGNTGMNSYFQPTQEKPIGIVAKDFDNNDSVDPVITYFNPVDNNRFMVHNRLVIIDQIPSIKKRFETFTKFATTPFEKVFTDKELKDAFTGKINTLMSVILVSQQGKSFAIQPLPELAQLSVVNDMLMEDVNADGNIDLVLIGNNYAQETLFGRYDASIGTLLLGDGKMNWTNLEATSSGFVVEGDAKYIRSIRTANGKMYVITNNNAALDCFSLMK
jgi:enediyne biosynthesis protein E4